MEVKELKKFKCSDDEWNRFVPNIGRYSHKQMCKKFGLPYMTYIESSYLVKGSMNDEEFCKEHGIPLTDLRIWRE